MDNKRPVFSGWAYLLLALMLLLLPLPWIGAMILAAAVHELGHYAAIRIFSGRGVSIRIGAWQARMPLPEMARWQELVCAMSGPAAGMSLLLLARWLPRTALFALGQSVYNLMPIYPLDGGRALRCLLSMSLPPPAVQKVCAVVEATCRVILVLLAIYAAFRFELGLLPLVAVYMLLFRTK